MEVYNVRFGLATNSSSSHSLIFLKEGVVAHDHLGYHHSTEPWENTTEYTMGEFGWQQFTAASPKAKMQYLGVLLRDRFATLLPPNICNLIIRDWLDGIEVQPDDHIDHQSWHFLPNEFGKSVPDEEFFKQLKTYFLNDRLVILGGNDNESADHYLDDGSSFVLPLPRDGSHSARYTCRYDSKYDYWVVFDPDDGTKVRFRLTTDPQQMRAVPDKAYAPELVDVKITDFCPFACEFCYQSSTTKGKHADSYDMYSLISALASLKVFEVALGGGEPTLHPQFAYILSNFKKHGIVANFTTRNLQWLRNPQAWPEILENCGAFAVSVSDESQIKELATLLEYNGIDKKRANLHFVMGTMGEYQFINMLKAAAEGDLSVTLLGYKNYGFGADYQPNSYDWWLKHVKHRRETAPYIYNVSIDTVLAAQYEQQILEADVPKYMFTTLEGKFPCYIDMVNKKIGPSSFCGEENMKPLKYGYHEGDHWVELEEVILKEFEQF